MLNPSLATPSPRLPAILLIILLAAQLLTGCAPAVQSLLVPTLSPIPSLAAAASRTPSPGKTPFIMPTVPLYGSKTPTATATLEPTVTPLPARAFRVLKIQPLVEVFKVYQRVELSVETDGSAGNPFDPAQVDLTVRFTAPGGTESRVPAFWFQDYDPNTLAPLGMPGWRVRFTPNAPGRWTAQAELSVPNAISSPPMPIEVPQNPAAHGFVRGNPNDPHYFAYDDGSFYFPIGLNVAWGGSDVLQDYTRWLDHLSQNGGNYIRVWMASWSFGLEWNDTGLGNYSKRMYRAWLLDQVFKLAEARGIQVMLCLVNHGAFSDQTDPEWSANPYNAALGGPLLEPQDFVSDAAAAALFKRRIRYIAARWAYSPNLAVWEWWNEVNWTPITNENLKPWIAEMTAELRRYDPYHHLVSTSWSTGLNTDLWSMAELSLAQQHDYSAADPLQALPDTLRQFAKVAGAKPVLMSEYGSSAGGENAPFNQDALHLHNGLWAAPFSGYAGTAMYWWWDNYVEPLNLWYQYRGIAEFMQGEDLSSMHPTPITISRGGAGALALQKSNRVLGWVRDDGYDFTAAKQAYAEAGKNGTVPAGWKYSLPLRRGLSVTLMNLENGRYQALWYSTLTGQTGQTQVLTITDGTLTLLLPDFQNDLAFKLVPVP